MKLVLVPANSSVSLIKRSYALIALAIMLVWVSLSSANAVNYSDTQSPTFKVEEIRGVNPELNLLLFKITVQDIENQTLLLKCIGTSKPPNCDTDGRFSFQAWVRSVPESVAPACTREELRMKELSGFVIDSKSLKTGGSFSSEFLLAVKKAKFRELPQGCPNWRNETDLIWMRQGRLTAADEAGNSIEVPIMTYLQNAEHTSQLNSVVCFIDSNTVALSKSLYLLSGSYSEFIQKYSSYPEYQKVVSNSLLMKNEEVVKVAKPYSVFYSQSFDMSRFNLLPPCQISNSLEGIALEAGVLNDFINNIVDMSNRISELANMRVRLEAEIKAKSEAEARAKAEAEAKAKAKVDAEARAKAEAAKKKSTIVCVKGTITRKISAINPKCPSGYKKK